MKTNDLVSVIHYRYVSAHQGVYMQFSHCSNITVVCFSDYSMLSEHKGIRRVTGFGVPITRGAASGQMFTYGTIMLTMCRNTITFLRETFLRRFIPFDSAISMHKYIAYMAVFFTGMLRNSNPKIRFLMIYVNCTRYVCHAYSDVTDVNSAALHWSLDQLLPHIHSEPLRSQLFVQQLSPQVCQTCNFMKLKDSALQTCS